jgi:hypothetical protein
MTLSEAQQNMSVALLGRDGTPAFSEATQLITFTSDDAVCYLRQRLPIAKMLKPSLAPLQTLGDQVAAADTLQQKRAAVEAINSTVNRDAGTGFVMLPSDSGEPIQLSLFNDIIETNCDAEATTRCGQANELAKALWWITGEFRALSNTLNQQDKAASMVFNERLNQQWRSYKDDTIKLWPQEVFLNSLVYQPEERGLSKPPSFKLLTLRPSLGLSYLSDDDHPIQPTLNVDLLGIYWWKYGGDGGVTAQPGRGLSASLVWDGNEPAYGVTYHHNPKWSATIAHSDENDVVISISFQLAHWLLRKR